MLSHLKKLEGSIFIAFFCSLILIVIVRAFVGSDEQPSVLKGALLTLSAVFSTLIVSKTRLSLVISTTFIVTLIAFHSLFTWMEPEWFVFLPIVTALYFCYAFIEISKKVLSSESSNFNVILGSVCAYILLGFIWGLGYSIIDTLAFDSFHFSNSEKTNDLMYYSFVTLTTLGFGDITPVTPLTKTLTIIEAIFGQIYLIVVISRIVSMQPTIQK